MEIINKVRKWQAIPMELIKDESLSFAAKGVYLQLATLPEDVEITAEHVRGDLNKRTIAKLFIELRDAGWLTVLSERRDGRKVYQLNVIKEVGTSANNAPETPNGECRKCTRASAENAPASRARNNIYNIYNNNNILLENRERRARACEEAPKEVIKTYHYPFQSGLTYDQKVGCLIDGVNPYVEQGIITPEQARQFVLYWSEPLAYDQGMLRMEAERAWKLSTKIERWVRREEGKL